MGDEITSCDFSSEDIREFKLKLRDETRVLMNWFQTVSSKKREPGAAPTGGLAGG